MNLAGYARGLIKAEDNQTCPRCGHPPLFGEDGRAAHAGRGAPPAHAPPGLRYQPGDALAAAHVAGLLPPLLAISAADPARLEPVRLDETPPRAPPGPPDAGPGLRGPAPHPGPPQDRELQAALKALEGLAAADSEGTVAEKSASTTLNQTSSEDDLHLPGRALDGDRMDLSQLQRGSPGVRRRGGDTQQHVEHQGYRHRIRPAGRGAARAARGQGPGERGGGDAGPGEGAAG